CQYRLTTTVHSPRPPFSLPSCSFLSTFFFYCSVPPRALHSFPTRRSSDLTHGVRLDQFYPTPAAVDPYHLARRAAFGDYIPPSTSVIMESCFGAASGISSSLIAVMPSAEYEIRKVYPQDVTASASSGFVPAVICSDFVFIAGQMASGREHGLDPRAHVPDHSLWAGTEIRKQTEFNVQERLKPALEAAGSALDHSVKAQVYLRNVADFPDFIDVWSQYYRD